jgi:hypothetical protein
MLRCRTCLTDAYEVEKQLVSAGIIGFGLIMALKLTPFQLLPHIGWSLFTINFVSLFYFRKNLYFLESFAGLFSLFLWAYTLQLH